MLELEPGNHSLRWPGPLSQALNFASVFKFTKWAPSLQGARVRGECGCSMAIVQPRCHHLEGVWGPWGLDPQIPVLPWMELYPESHSNRT